MKMEQEIMNLPIRDNNDSSDDPAPSNYYQLQSQDNRYINI